MYVMMTNVALSLQWCVPRVQAGGVGVGEASSIYREKDERKVKMGKTKRTITVMDDQE